MDFAWDTKKDKANQRKHGVSFATAAQVFLDKHRTERLDARSIEEERWATTGLVAGFEIYVVYVQREQTTRLISARRANRYEREEYWNRAL